MTEDIDYQAVSEQLQTELEKARFTILKLTYDRPSFHLNGAAIRGFVEDNYTVIILSVLLISLLLNIARITWLTFKPTTTKE